MYDIKNLEPLWGEWYIEGYLGSGAWGDVWEIRRGEERDAVKVLYFEGSDSERATARYEGMDAEGVDFYLSSLRESTFREYSIMKLFSESRYIVQCYDSIKKTFEEDNRTGWLLLFRMEKLQPLYTRISEAPLTIPEVIKIGTDICRALEECLAHGIFHRDVAPKNIFYCPQTGCYKLGDFGLAQGCREVLSVPEKPGTYAAPEVYLRNDYTKQSDLYALGVIMYRMLNDFRLPFLPLYPELYTPTQRGIALFRRYQGELPPPPRVLRLYDADRGAGDVSHSFAAAETATAQVKVLHESAVEPAAKERAVRMSGYGATVTPETTELAAALGEVVMKAIHPDLRQRFASPDRMREALERL